MNSLDALFICELTSSVEAVCGGRRTSWEVWQGPLPGKRKTKAMELFELTQALINIESVTGHERACAEFLHGYLVARSFEVEFQPVSRDRSNVFAKKGKPDVVLSTHIDTVPPFFLAHEDEEFIYGRGSCDAKGIVASQIAAAERLLNEGAKILACSSWLERKLRATARARRTCTRLVRYIINGEPTENKLVVGSKGNLRVDIRFKGKMAHSAYPHLGESAIDKLLDVLADLRSFRCPTIPCWARHAEYWSDLGRKGCERCSGPGRGPGRDSNRERLGGVAPQDFGVAGGAV